MRGVFDEQGVDRPRPTRDTELTLGSGTLLGIFFGLVLLCGLFFGMGYSMGHRAPAPTATTAPQPAPDQEPLQPDSAIPKPSAIAQTPVAAPADGAATDSAGTASSAAAATPAAGSNASGAAGQPAAANQNQPQVHPALGQGSAPESAPSAAPAVHPALAPSQQLMVQIAAVSNPQDAEVLVNALRKRDYPVTAHRDSDNYIHIRIGPFANRAIADQWRLKLLNDGYNAVIQP